MIERLFIPLEFKKQRSEALDIFSNLCIFFFLAFFLSSGSQISVVFLISVAMKEGEKSGALSCAGKGEATAEEKGKTSTHGTRVSMDFDPKTTRLHGQEDVDEYLKKYGVELSPGIKVKFCPLGTKFGLSPSDGGVYMHPKSWRWG